MCIYAPWGSLVNISSICKVLSLYLVKDFSTCGTYNPKNIWPRYTIDKQWSGVGHPCPMDTFLVLHGLKIYFQQVTKIQNRTGLRFSVILFIPEILIF
jgi:hypothetical protein